MDRAGGFVLNQPPGTDTIQAMTSHLLLLNILKSSAERNHSRGRQPEVNAVGPFPWMP